MQGASEKALWKKKKTYYKCVITNPRQRYGAVHAGSAVTSFLILKCSVFAAFAPPVVFLCQSSLLCGWQLLFFFSLSHVYIVCAPPCCVFFFFLLNCTRLLLKCQIKYLCIAEWHLAEAQPLCLWRLSLSLLPTTNFDLLHLHTSSSFFFLSFEMEDETMSCKDKLIYTDNSLLSAHCASSVPLW